MFVVEIETHNHKHPKKLFVFVKYLCTYFSRPKVIKRYLWFTLVQVASSIFCAHIPCTCCKK